MTKETIKKIIELPIENVGLSVGSSNYLKQIGIRTLSDLIYSSKPSYEELYNRIFKTTPTNEIQKYYNEIIDYLRYVGIKIQEKQKTK